MNIISTRFGKYLLFFAIPALTVLVSAKQPTNAWETTILVGTMFLQGFIAVKALQSDPNTTDQDKSDNMPDKEARSVTIEQPANKPIPVTETPNVTPFQPFQ